MASLRSLIMAGKIRENSKDCPNVADIKNRNTILVNAQSTYASVHQLMRQGDVSLDVQTFQKIPRPKPPYHQMWIESIQSYDNTNRQARTGIFTARESVISTPNYLDGITNDAGIREQFKRDYPTDAVMGSVWIEQQGEAAATDFFFYWLDASGNYQSGLVGSPANDPDIDPGLCQELWCLQTMAQLNCHNVELKPIQGQSKPKPQRKPHPPFSVWHEILVKPSPLVKRAQKQDPIDAEKHAVRLHKVRGHFADYRNGAGLFNKYKILIWVDEHEAGEAELGTVVSSYRV